jgi:MFS family permease
VTPDQTERVTAQADTRAAPAARTPAAAWRMLVLGIAAQAAGSLLVSTPVYLIPLLHVQRGIPLAQAGALASAPTIGMVLTLVAWGALADRYGERWVIAGGLALTAAFALAATAVHGFLPLALLLGLGGASAASTSAASGRVVVGWFPRWRRGLAMGLRQMSQPLGVAAAALVVPPLASRFGVGGPLLVAGLVLAVLALACALGVRNPPRPAAAPADGPYRSSPHRPNPYRPNPYRPNPYRQSSFLARIHLVSAFLVLPQFTLSTFGLVWLVVGLGWNQTAAGLVIGGSQIIGALGRILVGTLSDRVGGRVRVLRWVAVSGVAVMSLLALTGFLHWAAAGAVMLVIATTVSVADNGLAFTSVAEAAGPAWSGKALGIQNTGQFLAASAVGPGVGALIGAVGYPLAFALVALAPLVSIPLVPARDAIAPADLSRGWKPGGRRSISCD